MPIRDEMPMNGTTLCPHCDTRFKISGAQLTAHQGMVRCGHCLQIFDARTGFEPDQPNPQLELPIPDNRGQKTDDRGQTIGDSAAAETVLPELLPEETTDPSSPDTGPDTPDMADGGSEETSGADESPQNDDATSEDAVAGTLADVQDAQIQHESPDIGTQRVEPSDIQASEFIGPLDRPDTPEISQIESPQPLTLAEQVAIVPDADDDIPKPRRRRWPWVLAALLLLLTLLTQAAYFLRVDLAARHPELKPVLTDYCRMLNCSIPLPQHADFMSIESSGLEADPAHESQVTLNALLRNRAVYTQAFPHLELTLNDGQDKPLARRAFRPADYLPPAENESSGLLPNHEINIKLRLDTTDLKPAGYRLALFYPNP